ncbi:dynein intermediate chain 3, ciliary-like [Choristoneura fumiferana]|uniref:dynein intermediate chain 3, ciliary-like n=1 Tax=Choristoneura fumiferana TaxID=7141 RepID=UPI003D159563
MKMDDTYTYTKIRKNFGRQPMFCESPTQLLDSINPDEQIQKLYSLRNPVHTATQCSDPKSQHYVNTRSLTYDNTGVNHAEGGWAKDVQFWDEEATSRVRRRVERDDSYVEAVLGTAPTFDHYIKQNNAIDMYNMYFKDMCDQPPPEKSKLKVINVYRDPLNRQISCIGWTYEEDSKLIVAYCNRSYPVTGPVNLNNTCYIWDLENPTAPLGEFDPPNACWQIICSPIVPQLLVGGLDDGRVCLFDTRSSTQPVTLSPAHLAHRDPVTSLVYINSRLMTEFFSGSMDGKCMWWDIRNLTYPTDELLMCVRVPPGKSRSLAYSEGVSSMHFDKAFPTRFLCGTDTGYLINVNRKGKTPQEIMAGLFKAHYGPVKAVERSPTLSKMFITCGDFTVHIWSDDIHQSPMVTGISHRYQINDVCWSPQRVSSYMSISVDGKFRVWDFLRKYRAPVAVLPVARCPLLKLKVHDEGRFVAIGDMKGGLHMLSLSENLFLSGDRDKPLMAQLFDRETRREHLLENRIKEIKLKTQQGVTGPMREDVVDEEAIVKVAEDDYMKAVVAEMRRCTPEAAPDADIFKIPKIPKPKHHR